VADVDIQARSTSRDARRLRAALVPAAAGRIRAIEALDTVSVVLAAAVALSLAALATSLLSRPVPVLHTPSAWAVAVAVLVVARGAVGAAGGQAAARVAGRAEDEARTALAATLASAPPARPGAFASLHASGAAAIGRYVARAVPAREDGPLLSLAVLVVVAIVDPISALVAAVVLAVAPPVLASTGRAAAAESAAGLSRLSSLTTRALELIDGAVELRALGALTRGRQELTAATERMASSTRRSIRIGLRSAYTLDFLAGIAVGLVAMTDGFRLLGGSMDLFRALAAVLLTVEVAGQLRRAGAEFHAGADGLAALVLLGSIHGSVGPQATSAQAPLTCSIDAVGLLVSAVPGGAPVAAPVTVSVPDGGRLLVSGPSGSGKSTLLRALSGEPLVVGGELVAGGAEPARWSPELRRDLVAMVDQRPLVVAGSIYDNLVLGRPASRGDAQRAALACMLGGLLERSPAGLDTQVGEEGRLLSAGERVRVALARAVLREPRLLLLDEVGAHLDGATIDSLRTSLRSFLDGRTVVETAHGRPLLLDAPTIELTAAAVPA
jgi:ATP-binding cassette subfamily C protein CydCD